MSAEEHRAAPRRKVLKGAKVILDDWRALDCKVTDLSETGAKIRMGSTAILPHKFKLLMVAENTIRPVQVAWKLQDSVGVTFTGPMERAPVRKLVTGMC